MAIGEQTIRDVTYLNTQNQNLQPGNVVVEDIANSSATQVGCMLPTAALQQPLGVVVDKAKLDPAGSGAVLSGQGIAIRQVGKAFCISAAAIAAGDRVSIANVSGQVQTQARAAAGVQPAIIVGIAETPATAASQGVQVNLDLMGTTW